MTAEHYYQGRQCSVDTILCMGSADVLEPMHYSNICVLSAVASTL